jgi:hypothetical protein
VKKIKLKISNILALTLALGILSTLAYTAGTTYSVRRNTWGLGTSAAQIYELRSDGTEYIAGGTFFGNHYLTPTMPTRNTGYKFSCKVPVFNVGPTAAVVGDVLVASNTGVGYVIVSSATGLTTVVGVAADSIASGAVGWMIPLGGGYATVKTTGTVAVGDVLVSSGASNNATNGRAGTSTSANVGALIGHAVSSGSASGDTILAILH